MSFFSNSKSTWDRVKKLTSCVRVARPRMIQTRHQNTPSRACRQRLRQLRIELDINVRLKTKETKTFWALITRLEQLRTKPLLSSMIWSNSTMRSATLRNRTGDSNKASPSLSRRASMRFAKQRSYRLAKPMQKCEYRPDQVSLLRSNTSYTPLRTRISRRLVTQTTGKTKSMHWTSTWIWSLPRTTNFHPNFRSSFRLTRLWRQNLIADRL